MFRWNMFLYYSTKFWNHCLNSTMFRWNRERFKKILGKYENFEKILFKFHYVQMKQYSSFASNATLAKKFKFHYVQMKPLDDFGITYGMIMFKFHYVQMKQFFISTNGLNICRLNSTMFRWNIPPNIAPNPARPRFKFHYVQMKQI